MSMTAEERANKVVREYYLEGPPGRRWGVLIAAAIRAAEQEAEQCGAEQMREACAHLCDVETRVGNPSEREQGKRLAACIRILKVTT